MILRRFFSPALLPAFFLATTITGLQAASAAVGAGQSTPGATSHERTSPTHKGPVLEGDAHFTMELFNSEGARDPAVLFADFGGGEIKVVRITAETVYTPSFRTGNRIVSTITIDEKELQQEKLSEISIFERELRKTVAAKYPGLALDFRIDREKRRLLVTAHVPSKMHPPEPAAILATIRTRLQGALSDNLQAVAGNRRTSGSTSIYPFRLTAAKALTLSDLLTIRHRLQTSPLPGLNMLTLALKDDQGATTATGTSALLELISIDPETRNAVKAAYKADLLAVLQKGYSHLRLKDLDASVDPGEHEAFFRGDLPAWKYQYRFLFQRHDLKRRIDDHIRANCAGEKHYVTFSGKAFYSTIIIRWLSGLGIICTGLALLWLFVNASVWLWRRLKHKTAQPIGPFLAAPFRPFLAGIRLLARHPVLWLIPLFPWSASLLNDLLISLGRVSLPLTWVRSLDFQKVLFVNRFNPQDHLLIGAIDIFNPLLGWVKPPLYYLYLSVSQLTYAPYVFCANFLFVGLFIVVFLLLLNWLRRLRFREREGDPLANRNFYLLLVGMVGSFFLLAAAFVIVSVLTGRQDMLPARLQDFNFEALKTPLLRIQTGIVTIVLFTFLQGTLLVFLRTIIERRPEYNRNVNLFTGKLFGEAGDPNRVFDAAIVNDIYAFFFRIIGLNFLFLLASTFFIENIFTISLAGLISYEWLGRYLLVMLLSKALVFFYLFAPFAALEGGGVSDWLHKNRVLLLRDIGATVRYLMAGLIVLAVPLTLYVLCADIKDDAPLNVALKYAGYVPYLFANLAVFIAVYLVYREGTNRA